MSEKKELEQEQLEKVTGGDYGDSNYEAGDTEDRVRPLYEVGQIVDMYINETHILTKQAEIKSIRIAKYTRFNPGCVPLPIFGKYVPYYTVHVIDGNYDREILSDDISFKVGGYN